MKRSGIRRAVIRALRSGEQVPAGTPKRYVSGHGYVRLRWLVGTQQYVEVYEHRVVDGVVTSAEHVHHDNRAKDDNVSGNLVPLTAEEHNRLHAEERKGQRKYGPYRSRAAKEKAEQAQARREERRARAEQMRTLYLDEHLTTREIAARLGVHNSGVSRELRGIGVRLRPVGKRSPTATDPKPGVRQVITARGSLRCERCGRSVKWTPRHIHHRKPRGMGGSSAPAINEAPNLLLLCVDCHQWVESNREVSHSKGWLVHREHDPAETPVCIASQGWCLLSAAGSYIPVTERTAVIKQFRKKPIVISAVQWTGNNEDTVQQLTGPHHFYAVDFEDRLKDPDITARVLDDLHSTWVGVKTGQWVIKGVAGEFYPIDETVLAETYEQVVA